MIWIAFINRPPAEPVTRDGVHPTIRHDGLPFGLTILHGTRTYLCRAQHGGACAAIRRAIGEAPHDLDRIDLPATRAPAKRSRVHPAERHDGLPFGLTILRPDANLFVPYATRRAIIASPHD